MPGWRLPFTRNALFTGRVEPLLALARTLLHGGAGATLVTQAVHGMGGVGKTQLAVEFAYRYGRYFRGVHWLNAAQPAELDAEVAECGLALGLPNWPDKQPEQVARTLKAWSESGPRLVILDNLEDVPAARDWLGRLGGGGTVRLLVTARHTDWPDDLGLEPLPLKVFLAEESCIFLRRYLSDKRATDTELAALTERLGHLPLALELAGRYLKRQQRLSVDGYLGRRATVLDHPSMGSWLTDLGSPTGHDLDLAATFALSWQRVTNAAARRVFALAAWCAPNQPIPYKVLEKAAGLDEAGCDEAVGLLAGLGLVEWDGGQAGLKVHPLLAEFARKAPTLIPAHLSSMGKGMETPLAVLVGVLVKLSYEAIETGLPAQFVPLRPHVEVAAASAEEAGLELAGVLWNELGYHRRMVAEYAGARTAHERALAIDEQIYGPDHPAVAIRVNNLGRVLQDLGDLAGAQAAFERALAIDEQIYGSVHPEVATAVSNLGTVLQELGDLSGARSALERALRVFRAVYGEEHPHVATALNNLGSVLKDLGDLVGARAAYERSLTIDERVYGPNHPAIAICVNNLGDVLRDLGDLAGARVALERALAIDEQVYGLDHPAVATVVNNLGSVLHALGDLVGAREAYKRALDILAKTLPSEHPYVAHTWNNVSGVLRDLGDLAGARSALERALAIDERVYGLEHLDVAIRVNNLGNVLQDLGDLTGARAAYERALAIRLKFLPEGHPAIARVQRNLDSLPKT